MKFTIRLSKKGQTISQLLNPAHKLSGHIKNWGGIQNAEAYYGTSYDNPPTWVDFVKQGVTKSPKDLNDLNSSGATCIIFIPVSGRYMCYTFGLTVGKFQYQNLENDFGLKVVLNTVDPMKLKSIDARTVDTVVTNKRTQLSKENKIEDFGFEINKDMLRSVAGKPSLSTFASVVAGSDSLTVNCDISIKKIKTKSAEILKEYESKKYKTNYAWIDNIKVEKNAAVIAQLDNEMTLQLNLAVGSKNSIDFQLACPVILDFTTVGHFKIKGYRSTEEFAMPDFEKWIADLITQGKSIITLSDLHNHKILVFDGSGGKTEYLSWPVYNWIICEVNLNKSQYILSDGQWYEISKSYFQIVEKDFQTILKNKPNEYRQLSKSKAINEIDYFNIYKPSASECTPHGQLFNAYGGRNTVEICDIYDNRNFIHVKDGGFSSKLSHLFNQGFVSATLLLNDTEFRKHIQKVLKSNPISLKSLKLPPVASDYTVVYRILKSGTKFQLPFFSKVVLTEMYRKIKSMGFNFRLEWVPKG
jgi:uncharacterized protein (TIGR04141 family)